MSNITLSAGIRQNLLSLQDTAANLTTTQEHLSTGKKVNTAFDNPTSYFTSQSLNNRANDLSSLLDQIGQAQQTLDAANNGLTSLTSLLEQALSTAQQAQQTTPTGPAVTTGSVALTTPTEAAGNLLINVGATSYTVAITASESLSSIEAAINGTSGLGANGAVTASDDGSGHLVLTGNTNTTAFTVSANAEVCGARRHHQRHSRQRRRAGLGHAHHVAGQLQQHPHADRPARRRFLVQRRQPARRRQPEGALQREWHQLADHQRRELQLEGSRPVGRLRHRVPRQQQHHRLGNRDQCRDLPRCVPRPRRSVPTRARSRPVRRSSTT